MLYIINIEEMLSLSYISIHVRITYTHTNVCVRAHMRALKHSKTFPVYFDLSARLKHISTHYIIMATLVILIIYR